MLTNQEILHLIAAGYPVLSIQELTGIPVAEIFKVIDEQARRDMPANSIGDGVFE